MPPGPKRKRGDRTYSYDGNDGSQRPSPHRPGSLSLAQQQQQYQNQEHSQHFTTAQGHNQGQQGQTYGSRGGISGGGANNRRVSRGGRGNRPGHTQPDVAVAGAQAAYASSGSGNLSQHHTMGPQRVGRGREGSVVGTPTASPTSTRKQSSSAGTPAASISTVNTSTVNVTSVSRSINNAPTTGPQQASTATVSTAQRSEAANVAPPKVIAKPKPYAYEYLSDECVGSWSSTGKESFVDAVTALKNAHDKDPAVILSVAFQELVRAGLDSRIPATDAGLAVKQIIEGYRGYHDGTEENRISLEDTPNAPLDPVSLFLDTISILTEADQRSPVLQPLMVATDISVTRMRAELETSLLISIGLLRDTFARMGIRKTTNILYRQSNYNLLREESEGYSKLITEYFTISNSSPPTSEVVKETLQRILALIGAFDLDVGRVLDVTLDVFADLLVKRHKFFIKLLRGSSWWPTPKETAATNILAGTEQANDDPTSTARDLEVSVGLSLDPLPWWALPSFSESLNTEEEQEKERQRLNFLRDKRDRLFWDRVQEVGIKAYFELNSGITALTRKPDNCKDYSASGASEIGNATAKIATPSDEEERDWISKTGITLPVGNRTAAQLLGFKLRFYASAARGPHDQLPDNLIHLAALLIKTGFISLRDLYPHLYPNDEMMENSVKEKLSKEKIERDKKNRPGAGAMNALMTAAALTDDTVPAYGNTSRMGDSRGGSHMVNSATAGPTPKAEGLQGENTDQSGSTGKGGEEANESSLPEPADQKIHLLKSLLLVGAIPEALFILGKFPWLMDLVPDLPDYIHRILNHSVSKVYEPLRPLHDRDSIRVAKRLPTDQSPTSSYNATSGYTNAAISKGDLRFTDPPPRKTLWWANLDKHDSGDGIDYRFYWEDWADNVPICQNIDDIFLLCKTLLNLSGVKIGKDPDLLMKLSRIGRHSLSTDNSDSNMSRWIDLAKRLLVPALSLTKTNPGLVNEMFDLLKHFPVRSRFGIYAEWYTGPISRLPDIRAAFDIANAETKVTLKRISKTNTKPMARALAKIAYSSPGVVFEVTLNQIEAYENLIEVVVECARYFTYLGYDVLTWSLMNALGSGSRAAVGEDGMMTRQWLKMLAIFAGRVFKRYSVMSPAPILQFVANQLRSGNVTGLDVLEQIISFMAGIRPDISFNEAQIQAMAGGELLQMQTLEQLYDDRPNVKQSSRRLLRALTEPSLAVYMLIAIAQVRQTAIFRNSETNAPPKVLGNSLDKIHRVFTQYLDMLRGNLSMSMFDESVPDVAKLIKDFKLDASAAFAITRPSLSHLFAEAEAAMKAERQEKTNRTNAAAAATAAQQEAERAKSKQVQNDIKMEDGEQQQPEEKVKSTETIKTENDSEANNELAQVKSEEKDAPATSEAVVDTEMKDADQIVQQEVDKNAQPASTDISAKTTNSIVNAPTAYTPPMRLLLNDLKSALPIDFEKSMSISFYATFWQLSLNDMLVPSSSYEDEIKRQRDKIAAVSADRTDLSVTGMRRKEARKKELNEMQDKLRTELKSQIHKYSQIRARLQKEKDRWFVNFVSKPSAEREQLHDALLQECFLPRLLFSPLDALYTFKMIFFLHASGPSGFSTVNLLDRIFREKQLTALIFFCTLQESESLGRFLAELLKELRRWHADFNTYEKMAFGPKKDLPGFAEQLREDGTPESFIGYEDFRRRLLRWHKNLTAAFKTCFSEGEYMHMRNAINVLKPLPPHYPVVNWMGNNILDELKRYEKDPREDIKVSTMSLLSEVQKRKNSWIMHAAFSTADREKTSSGATNSTSTAEEAHVKSDAVISAKSGTAITTGAPGKEDNTGSQGLEGRSSARNVGRASNVSVPKPIDTSVNPPNANVPDFQSQRKASSTVRAIKTPTTARSEFEDGEIDDAKSGTPKSALVNSLNAGASVNTTGNGAKDIEGGKSTSGHGESIDSKTDQSMSMPAPPPKEKTTFAAEDHRPANDQSKQESNASITNESKHVPDRPTRSAEPMRTQSGQSLSGRAVHALPQRPEHPQPRPVLPPDRLNEQGYEPAGHRRDTAGYGNNQDYVRGAGNGRPISAHDGAYNNHSEATPGNRVRQRTPDRNMVSGPERDRRNLRDRADQRHMRPPPRDTRASGRSGPWSDGQAISENERGRASYDAAGGSQSAAGYGNDRTSSTSAERASYVQTQQNTDRKHYDKQPSNTSSYPLERMEPPYDRSTGSRERDGRRDRTSRPHSPRGGPAQPSYHHGNLMSQDDRRSNRSEGPDRPSQRSDYNLRERWNDSATPSGPRYEQRQDRLSEFADGMGSGRPGRGRDLFHSAAPSNRTVQDLNHGRLSQDPNYGRLNADPDIPQGPRGRVVGRGNRNVTAPQSSTYTAAQRVNESANGSQSGSQPIRSEGTERQAVSNVRERATLTGVNDNTNQSQPRSSSTTPLQSRGSDGSHLSGIHPSRLNQFTGSQSQQGADAPSRAGTTPGGQPNDPSQGPRTRQMSGRESSITSDHASQTSRPGANAHQSNNDRRSEDKRFAGIHDVLQQGKNNANASQQDNTERGTPILGRAARNGSFHGNNPPMDANHSRNSDMQRDRFGTDGGPPGSSDNWQDHGQGYRQVGNRSDRSGPRYDSEHRQGHERMTRQTSRHVHNNSGSNNTESNVGPDRGHVGSNERELRRVRSEMGDHGRSRDHGNLGDRRDVRPRDDDGYRRGPASQSGQPQSGSAAPPLPNHHQPYHHQQNNSSGWSNNRNAAANSNAEPNSGNQRFGRDLRSRQSMGNLQDQRGERDAPSQAPPLPPPKYSNGNNAGRDRRELRGGDSAGGGGGGGGGGGSSGNGRGENWEYGRDARDMRDSRDARDMRETRDGRKRLRDGGAGGAGGASSAAYGGHGDAGPGSAAGGGNENKRPRRTG